MDDLVLLVADKNMQFSLRGALSRPEAMGIRPVSFDFRTHVGRDGGVRKSGAEVLSVERARFTHALAVLDLEGCGAKHHRAEEIEGELDAQLSRTWSAAARSIVVAPEIDVWLWGSDNVLKEVLAWPLPGTIRQWLREQGFEFDENNKPFRPKEALEAMTRIHRQPRSSALYEKVTRRISLPKCQDRAFQRLRAQLQAWFPPQ